MFGTVVTVESKEHVVKVSNLNDEYEEHYDLESRLRSTSVYFLSITPMASLESLDQIGLEGFLFKDCFFTVGVEEFKQLQSSSGQQLQGQVWRVLIK